MKYIRIKSDLISVCDIIPVGTILPVEVINGRWRVTEGRFQGTIINGYECEPVYTQSEYNELYQELMNSRAEVHELKRANESLVDEVEQLTRESESKMVKLPREVAEAIEYNRVGWTDVGIVNLVARKKDGSGLLPVISWVYGDAAITKERQDLLLRALVNGYEIEEPEASVLEDEITEMVAEWSNTPAPANKTQEDDYRTLAKRILRRLEQDNAARSG